MYFIPKLFHHSCFGRLRHGARQVYRIVVKRALLARPLPMLLLPMLLLVGLFFPLLRQLEFCQRILVLGRLVHKIGFLNLVARSMTEDRLGTCVTLALTRIEEVVYLVAAAAAAGAELGLGHALRVDMT